LNFSASFMTSRCLLKAQYSNPRFELRNFVHKEVKLFTNANEQFSLKLFEQSTLKINILVFYS
jgi:hypothetical protein